MNMNMKFGTWAEIPTPYATHIMAKAGFDFSIIDMEHGVIDFETAQDMIFAAHAEQKEAYIRVPEITEAWTLRCLDMGCDGIVFPGVTSKEDVEKIIEFAMFPPAGKRGFNPYIAAGGYTSVSEEYFEQENKRIKLAVILEGREAFDRLEDLLAFEEIAVFYIGQYDLSAALGVPGDVTNPEVLQYMDKAVRAINAHGKMAGCMVHSAAEAKQVMGQGFSFVAYKVDSGLLYDAVSRFVKEVSEK